MARRKTVYDLGLAAGVDMLGDILDDLEELRIDDTVEGHEALADATIESMQNALILMTKLRDATAYVGTRA